VPSTAGQLSANDVDSMKSVHKLHHRLSYTLWTGKPAISTILPGLKPRVPQSVSLWTIVHSSAGSSFPHHDWMASKLFQFCPAEREPSNRSLRRNYGPRQHHDPSPCTVRVLAMRLRPVGSVRICGESVVTLDGRHERIWCRSGRVATEYIGHVGYDRNSLQ
jgi:hypothetical protein